MAAYQLVKDVTGADNLVKRNSDGAFIPFDAKNADYIIYLAWVATPNTPDPS